MESPQVLTLTAIFPLGDVCESMTFGEAFAVYPSFETADYDADPEHSAPDSSANQFQALARSEQRFYRYCVCDDAGA